MQYLAELPDVFDLSYFCHLARIGPDSAKVMLSRWAARGLIEHAGPRCGIYYKRFGQTLDESELLVSAVLTVYPSAVVVGPSVLRARNWITQVPRSLHIAVPFQGRSVQMNGALISWRSPAWLNLIDSEGGLQRSGLRRAASSWDAIPKLLPAWALADLLAHEDGWHPDPDDLDIPPEAGDDVVRACLVLGVPAARVDALGPALAGINDRAAGRPGAPQPE